MILITKRPQGVHFARNADFGTELRATALPQGCNYRDVEASENALKVPELLTGRPGVRKKQADYRDRRSRRFSRPTIVGPLQALTKSQGGSVGEARTRVAGYGRQ